MAESPGGRARLRAATAALAVYWVALLAGTHWPRQFLPRENLLFSKDKLLHFSAYTGLAFLMLNAVRLKRRAPSSSTAAAFGQGARKTRHFHVVADGAYGGQSVLNHLPAKRSPTGGTVGSCWA